MGLGSFIWYGGRAIDLSYVGSIPTYPNDGIYAIGVDPFAPVLTNPELINGGLTGFRFGYGGTGKRWAASIYRRIDGKLRFLVKGGSLIEFDYPDFAGADQSGFLKHHLVSIQTTTSDEIGRLYWNDGTEYQLALSAGEFLAFPGLAAPKEAPFGTTNQWALRSLYDNTRMRILRRLTDAPETSPYPNVEYRDGYGEVQVLDASTAQLDGFLDLATSNNNYIHPYVYSIVNLSSADYRETNGTVIVSVNKVDLDAGTITLERTITAGYRGQPDTSYSRLSAVYYP